MKDNDQILALDNQICFALYAANRAVTARYRPLLEELGLTVGQRLKFEMKVAQRRQQDQARSFYYIRSSMMC